MRYALALVLSVLCTLSIVVAQTPAQPPQAPGQPSQQQPPPAVPTAQTTPSAKVTYTGCLKPGTTADSWTLESAELASATGAIAQSPTPDDVAAGIAQPIGTSGAGAKTTFGLNVKPAQNLTPHANHKIQVVGTLSPAAGATAPGTTPGTAAAGAASTTTTTVPRQNLTVESFKMVSATCP
jgi:hypothetical protein